jgi:lipopolysaccharide export system protein LptA
VSWQKRARYVIALIGFACAGAVFYYGHQRKPAPAPPPAVKPLDPQATGQALQATLVRRDGDKVVYKITSAVRTEFPDRMHFEGKVHFEKPGDERSFEMNSDSADQSGDNASRKGPASVLANGGVDLKTNDGLELKADSMTYHDSTGIVEVPGHVEVVRGRLHGEANGATWNRDTNVLWLLDAAHAVQAPDEHGEGGFDARSKTMQLARNDKFMRMDGNNPVITRDKETLSADFLILHFTQDEQGLERIEMRGHSAVDPKPDAKDGPPAMKADDITLGFHPDGRSMKQSTLNNNASLALRSDAGPRTITARWIDTRMAPDGQTITGLDAKERVDVMTPETVDTPARKIDAPTLTAKGDDKKGLTNARFDGGVDFVETRAAKGTQAATKRTAKSKTLILGLNGAIDAVQDAEFRQEVTFKDGDMTALAGWAKYFATSGDLQLKPPDTGAKIDPWVTNGSIEASAHEVKVSGSHDLDAAGDVKTVSITQNTTPPAHAQSPGFFDDD